MRVTNHTFFQSSLENIQKGFSELEAANRRTAHGLKVERPSDDPSSAAEILATSRDLRANEQFSRNIEDGNRRLRTEETVLDSLTDILGRTRELATAEAGATGDANSRAAAKLEVDQLFFAAVSHGNTFVSGAYLFGGRYADVKPFDPAGAPSVTQPPQGEHHLQIGETETAIANHDGEQVFLNSNVFSAMTNLSAALGADDGPAIQSSLSDLNLAFDNVQGLLTEVGARSNRLERAQVYIETHEFTLIEKRSSLQDADLAETALEFANKQNVLQGAMLATSRAISLTITEYLR